MCVSLPQPTVICRKRLPQDVSAKIYSTGFPYSKYICRRYANGRAMCVFWQKPCEELLRQVGASRYGYYARLSRSSRATTLEGNIRELRNVIERSLIVSEGERLDVADLPLDIQNAHYEQSDETSPDSFELSAMERRHIARVLEYTKGNKTEAARLLKIGLTTLYRKIEEYGI